jgi:hypothetical protein
MIVLGCAIILTFIFLYYQMKLDDCVRSAYRQGYFDGINDSSDCEGCSYGDDCVDNDLD